MTLGEQRSQYFSGNHIRTRVSNVPRKEYNIQTGAKKFLPKFLQTQDQTYKLGQNFCQNFYNLKMSTDIPNWGKNFCQNFYNLKMGTDIPNWGKVFVKTFAISIKDQISKLG